MKVLFIIIASFVSTILFSQIPQFNWVASNGGIRGDEARCSIVDDSLNVLTVGYFWGTVDFDPDTGFFNLVSGINGSGYIQKLNSNGKLVWAKSWNSSCSPHFITSDKIGNIYVVGGFHGTGDFDPDTGNFMLNSNGSSDIFITKLDSSGKFIWVRSIGGVKHDQSWSLSVDEYGDITVLGSFFDTVDFDPDTSVYLVSATASWNGQGEVFILRLDSNGQFIWVKTFQGSGNEYGNAMVTDDVGNIYATGVFNGPVDFDPGPNVSILTPGSANSYVVKLNKNGIYQWAVSYGETSSSGGMSIDRDIFGNIFTTGYFYDTIDLDPGPNKALYGSQGLWDCYILKLDSIGNFVWGSTIGSSGHDQGDHVHCDPIGNVYLTGYFENTADFDPGLNVVNLTSKGSHDVFVQKLDNNGNLIWAESFGNSNWDEGNWITTDNKGGIYISGYFWGPVDFDAGPDSLTLNSVGWHDAFVLKMSDCDSSVINDSVLINGNVLTALDTGYNYQWINCTQAGDAIIGETNQSFSPVQTGSYAVLISDGHCWNISGCIEFNPTSIDEHKNYSVSIYPNPFTQDITFDIKTSQTKNGTIQIVSITGQEVYNQSFTSNTPFSVQKVFDKGLYFAQIRVGDQIKTVKVIKQ